MQPNDHEIAKLQKSAFNYGLYKARNFDIAEEISLEVVSIYLLRYDKIDDPEKWIINATKIQCSKHFRLQKKNNELINSIHNELQSHILKSSESNEELKQAFQESYDSLNEDELSTVLYYFNCEQNIKQMALYTGESYATLRKRVSRIKNKLKAETFRRLGYYGSKKIVTPQLNELIKKFLSRFKMHAESDTLDKMFYYFSEVDLNRYNLIFGIKKIMDYDITIEDSVYKTWVVFEDKEGKPSSFRMSFIVDDNNHLKIISPPKLLQSMNVVKINSPRGQELQKVISTMPSDLSGHPNIPKEELDKLLKQIRELQNKPE